MSYAAATATAAATTSYAAASPTISFPHTPPHGPRLQIYRGAIGGGEGVPNPAASGLPGVSRSPAAARFDLGGGPSGDQGAALEGAGDADQRRCSLMDAVREGVEGSRGGGRRGVRSEFRRQEICSGVQGSCRSRIVESRLENLLRGQQGGEAQDAASIRAASSVRSLGKAGSEVNRSESCREMGLHHRSDAYPHPAAPGAGGSLAIPLTTTVNGLREWTVPADEGMEFVEGANHLSANIWKPPFLCELLVFVELEVTLSLC